MEIDSQTAAALGWHKLKYAWIEREIAMKPTLRSRKVIAFLMAVLIMSFSSDSAFSEHASDKPGEGLDAYLKTVAPIARAAGVTSKTLREALDGLTDDPEVLALTRRQPEYNLSIGAYLSRAVSASRIAKGRKLLNKWSDVLDRVEARYGVDRCVILALWAIETEFGAAFGAKDVVRSLATLAHARYRDDFFRDELIQALLVMQGDKIDRATMKGSWAGAMGQPQFLPSSYRKYAVDFDGDGRRDIWTSVPDTLASIANYLKSNGWTKDAPWGMAVHVPDGYDLRLSRGGFRDWTARGVAALTGSFPAIGNATLFHPAGYPGPAFLATPNYDVIKTYNNSDAYALAVVFLADGIRGSSSAKLAWPDRLPLRRDDRIALQRALARLGYKVSNFQGWIDFDIRDAVRKLQAENGMTPDGEPDNRVLSIAKTQASRIGN